MNEPDTFQKIEYSHTITTSCDNKSDISETLPDFGELEIHWRQTLRVPDLLKCARPSPALFFHKAKSTPLRLLSEQQPNQTEAWNVPLNTPNNCTTSSALSRQWEMYIETRINRWILLDSMTKQGHASGIMATFDESTWLLQLDRRVGFVGTPEFAESSV